MTNMNPKDLKPGPIRRTQLSPELVVRLDAVRAALAEVFTMTEAEWLDGFQRDANPENEMLWWERVAGCYVALVTGRIFQPEQGQAAFKVIFGLFSGIDADRLQADIALLPESGHG